MPFVNEQRGAGNTNTEAGLDTTRTGLSLLGQARQTISDPMSYWKGILSGNRPAALQAVAPEANSVQAQTDAAKRQQSAMGTARGGGNAGANRTVDDEAMAKIDNLLFGARPGAAQQISSIGGQEADVAGKVAATGQGIASLGQDEIAKALQALGLSESAAAGQGNVQNQSTANNQTAFNNFLRTLI